MFFLRNFRSNLSIGIIGVVFAACANMVNAAPTEGGTLTILSNSTISTLNPAIQSGVPTAVPGSQLFASLLLANDQWEYEPYLAESWEIENNGREYTFQIKNNAVFHDGVEITSEDVAFSIEVVKNNHPFGKAIYEHLDKVEILDKHKLKLHFNKPNPALLLSVSTPALLPIIPKHIYEKSDPIRSSPHNIEVIGSGPFKFVEYSPGRHIILDRFEDFFGEGPYLDRLIISIITDVNAATLAIQQAKIQYAPYPPLRLSQVRQLSKNSKLKLTTKGYEAAGQLSWLGFNLIKEGPLQDVRVRKAISYAIDRNFIVEKLHSGLTKPAYGPIHPSSPYYNKDLNKYDVDVERANALLDEANFPADDEGVRFSLTVDYQPINPDLQQNIAEYLRSQLKKVGIKVEVRTAPDMATWMKRVANYEYDMTVDNVFNWGDPLIGVSRSYVSDNIRKGVAWANMSGYKNSKVDSLLAQGAVAETEEERKKHYNEFQEIVNDELPVAWLFAYFPNTVYSATLKDHPEGVWGAFAPLNLTHWEEGKN